MADHFYSVLRGDGLDPATVTAGTSTSGEAIELRTRDGLSLNRQDVLNALKCLEYYFEKPNNAVTA